MSLHLKSGAVCIVALALAPWLAPTPALAGVTIVSSENAPFAYTDKGSGKITGVSTELLAEAFARTGIASEVAIYPWARAYMMAKNTPDTCVFPLTRLPDRENQFQWVGPLSSNKWVLFARADFSGVIRHVGDASRYSIGGLIDDGPSVYLKSLGLTLELTGDHHANVKKLASGRVQLWATGLARGTILAAEMGVQDIKPVFVIREVEHYMACPPAMSGTIVNQLNKALDTMRADGSARRIIDRYERAMSWPRP